MSSTRATRRRWTLAGLVLALAAGGAAWWFVAAGGDGLLADGPLVDGAGWRNDGRGIFPGDAPLGWTSEHATWSVETPDISNSSAVVWGEQVFTMAEPSWLVAFDRTSGKLLWRRSNLYADTVPRTERASVEARLAEAALKEVALTELQSRHGRLLRKLRSPRLTEAAANELRATVDEIAAEMEATEALLRETDPFTTPPTGNMIGYTSATPSVTADGVFSLTANGVLSAFRHDGTRIWSHYLGESPEMPGYKAPEIPRYRSRGHAAAAIPIGGVVVAPYGRMRAFSPLDGKLLWTWEEPRPYLLFSTPLPVRIDGEAGLVTSEGRAVRVRDGRTISFPFPLQRIFYTAPVQDPLGDPRVVFYAGDMSADEVGDDAVASAFRFEGGLLERERVTQLWQVPLDIFRVYAGSVAWNGRLYVTSDRGKVHVLDTRDGRLLQQLDLKLEEVMPSLALVGHHLLVSDVDGVAKLLDVRADPLKEVATGKLPPGHGSFFASEGQLFYRSQEALHCVGQRRIAPAVAP